MFKAQYAQKKYYDQYHCAVTYSPGNWVWLSTCNLHIPSATKSKLGPYWHSPFQVQALAGPKALHLSRLPYYLAVYPTFNVNLLKPAAAPPQAGSGPTGTSGTSHPGPTGPSSSPISEDEYEIECILRKYFFWDKCQYLVCQHGYRLSEDCWVQLSDIINTYKLLKAQEDERTLLWHSLRCHRDVS